MTAFHHPINPMRFLTLLLVAAGWLHPTVTRAQAPARPAPASLVVQSVRVNHDDPDVLDVDLYFKGPAHDFISYPYVKRIVNVKRQTIAEGRLEFFGQFGKTRRVYQVRKKAGVPFNSIGRLKIVVSYYYKGSRYHSTVLPYNPGSGARN